MDTRGEHRSTITELLQRFRAGDAEAAEELVRRYTPVIRHVVRERLPDRMRGEFESMDFAQEVWLAVCKAPLASANFADARDLKEYLARVATSRVVDALRSRSAGTRFTGSRDLGLTEAEGGPDPTPSQFAIADERWRTISESLPEEHVAVVERLRQGFTQQEIAEQTGWSLRTVNRILQRVQRQCEKVRP